MWNGNKGAKVLEAGQENNVLIYSIDLMIVIKISHKSLHKRNMLFGSYVFFLVSQNLKNDKWKIEKAFF